MSTRSPIRHFAALVVALVTVLAGFAGGSAAAQGEDASILLRAFACPDAEPSDPFTECDAMVGATFRIEANGAETGGSPATILRDMGIGPGATITVPSGADLTITLLSGAPGGYVPAPGFAPFSANVDDLPQVGFGGESTGPGATFIAVPAGDAEDDADTGGGSSGESDGGDDGGVSHLPVTGSGATAAVSDQTGAVGLLLVAGLLFGAGIVTRRQRAG